MTTLYYLQVHPDSIKEMFNIQEVVPQDNVIFQNVTPFKINEIPSLFPHSVLCTSLVTKTPQLPLTVLEAIDRCSDDMDNFMSVLSDSMTDINIVDLEKETREQYKCSLWKYHRRGRITSSTAHAAKGKTDLFNLIFKSKDISHLSAVKYGLEHEAIARKKFESIMVLEHTNFQVKDSGLQLHKDFPLLGASPDGIIVCDCHGTGCLEIKCPSTFKEGMPNITVGQTLKQFSYLSSNGSSLKETHSYYYQVQMHMLLTKVNYCYLFIDGADRVLNIRVERNDSFLQKMTTTLSARYNEILPSLKISIQND